MMQDRLIDDTEALMRQPVPTTRRHPFQDPVDPIDRAFRRERDMARKAKRQRQKASRRANRGGK